MEFRRILLLSHEMTYTGAPNSLLNVARTLRRHGHFVSIYTLHGGPFVKEFHRCGFRVHYYDDNNYTECERKKLAEKYDLMIANTVFCAKAAYSMQSFVKTILYLREAENLPEILENCNIDSRYISCADNVVCVSEYAKSFIQKTYSPKKLMVIHNFLVKRKFLKNRPNRTEDGKVHFLIAATIEKRKGIDIAIKAYELLSDEIKAKSVLHIAGRRPEWSEDYWKTLDLENNPGIVYHGEISDRKLMDKLISEINVIVVPSYDESCSLTVLEGAMHAKALIVTENVGAKYLVTDNNGYIVKTGCPESLSKAMTKIIDESARLEEYGQESVKRYKEDCTSKLYYKRIKKLFNELR